MHSLGCIEVSGYVLQRSYLHKVTLLLLFRKFDIIVSAIHNLECNDTKSCQRIIFHCSFDSLLVWFFVSFFEGGGVSHRSHQIMSEFPI